MRAHEKNFNQSFQRQSNCQNQTQSDNVKLAEASAARPRDTNVRK